MPNKKTSLIGIMISAEHENFKLYQMEGSFNYEQTDASFNFSSGLGSSWVKGLKDILSFLSLEREAAVSRFVNDATRFFIVYDVSCPKKEEHIKKILEEINRVKKDDQLPSLVSIGHEQSPLSEEITKQIASTNEVINTGDPNELFKDIIQKEMGFLTKPIEDKIKKERAKEFSINLQVKQKVFDIDLNILLKKAKDLRDDGHLDAAVQADTLHEKLTQLSKNYFSNPTEAAYITFKEQAKDELKEAHKELDKNRGWKRVLGNIGLAILGFGILYLVAIAINRSIFFNKTDSAEKLDNLEAHIDRNYYQIG